MEKNNSFNYRNAIYTNYFLPYLGQEILGKHICKLKNAYLLKNLNLELNCGGFSLEKIINSKVIDNTHYFSAAYQKTIIDNSINFLESNMMKKIISQGFYIKDVPLSLISRDAINKAIPAIEIANNSAKLNKI